jgi:hypothetical protein
METVQLRDSGGEGGGGGSGREGGRRDTRPRPRRPPATSRGSLCPLAAPEPCRGSPLTAVASSHRSEMPPSPHGPSPCGCGMWFQPAVARRRRGVPGGSIPLALGASQYSPESLCGKPACSSRFRFFSVFLSPDSEFQIRSLCSLLSVHADSDWKREATITIRIIVPWISSPNG